MGRVRFPASEIRLSCSGLKNNLAGGGRSLEDVDASRRQFYLGGIARVNQNALHVIDVKVGTARIVKQAVGSVAAGVILLRRDNARRVAVIQSEFAPVGIGLIGFEAAFRNINGNRAIYLVESFRLYGRRNGSAMMRFKLEQAAKPLSPIV